MLLLRDAAGARHYRLTSPAYPSWSCLSERTWNQHSGDHCGQVGREEEKGNRQTLTSAKKPTQTEREQCKVVAQRNWSLKHDGYSLEGKRRRKASDRTAKSLYRTRKPIRITFNSKITSNQQWILLYIMSILKQRKAQMAGLRAQMRTEQREIWSARRNVTLPRFIPNIQAICSARRWADGENEQMSISDHLTLSTLMFSPGRSGEIEFRHKVMCRVIFNNQLMTLSSK